MRTRVVTRALFSSGVFLLALLTGVDAHAQFNSSTRIPLGLDLPTLDRPALPTPGQRPVPVLPPPPPPRTEDLGPAPGQATIQVNRFEVSGVTVFSDQEIRSRLSDWTGRPISIEELGDARQALTRLYVDAGYINSGARMPSQNVRGGLVRLEVTEGGLDEIEIVGLEHLQTVVLVNRIRAGLSEPLNLIDLEETLRILQEDERIRSIDARLESGERRGLANLVVAVAESSRYVVDMAANNYRPPSVGGYGGGIAVRDLNPLGLGDELEFGGEFAEGLRRGEARYTIPVGRFGTRLGVYGRYTDSEVVGRLESLEIENESITIGFQLEHPVWETPNDTLSLGLIGEWRTSSTTLLGERFSLSEGAIRGRSTVSVARLQGEWDHRDLDQVFVARTTLSMGFDILDATLSGQNLPDGEFFSWLTQIQWARRLPWLDMETLTRFDLQLANDPLLSLEQFAVGGRFSVRGYTENRFVRDQGLIGSVELRIPVWRNGGGSRFVQVAPFFDVARSWNIGRPTGNDTWIYSAGIGLRARLWRSLFAEASWAHTLQDVSNFEDEPQSRGFSFGLTWRIF